LHFLSEESALERAVRSLWHQRLRLLVVTQGKAGCTYFTEKTSGHVSGFSVTVKDTTGAGDAFVAGMLSGLLIGEFTWEQAMIEKALKMGNAVGAISATQVGAMSSLPTREMVQSLLST
jgi:fructokinase